MRHIVQQSPLPLHQALQSLSHAVEASAEIGQFVLALPHGCTDAGLQSAGGGRLEGLSKRTNGTREISRQQGGEKQADQAARTQWQQWRRRRVTMGRRSRRRIGSLFRT